MTSEPARSAVVRANLGRERKERADRVSQFMVTRRSDRARKGRGVITGLSAEAVHIADVGQLHELPFSHLTIVPKGVGDDGHGVDKGESKASGVHQELPVEVPGDPDDPQPYLADNATC